MRSSPRQTEWGRWRPAIAVAPGQGLALETTGDVVVEAVIDQPLTLAASIPKGDRLDWMVQKATELGVDGIQLIHAERSVVRWKQSRAAHQLERLDRIVEVAARQSRRVRRVEICEPLDAIDVLPSAVAAEPGGRALDDGDHLIAVGPEDGWSDAELAAAADRVDLGPNVLRTETAALAARALSVARRR